MNKSIKSVRSMKSVKSLRSAALEGDDDTEDDEEERDFNNLVFEEALPNICVKFDCSYSVVVRKQFQRDQYLKMLKSEPKAKYKRISVMTPLQHQASQTFVGIRNPVTGDAASTRSGMFEDSSTVIVKAFYDNMDRLVEIVIRDVPKVPRIVMQAMALLVPYYELLTKITITRCGINVYTIHELNKMLPMTTLTDICLDDSSLREGNYAILLESASHLRNLSLSRCHINDEVCKQLASKLQFSMPAEKTLLLLNLATNKIADAGAKHLAETLKTNRHLRYLNLADNKITDVGAGYLFDSLAEFPLTAAEVAAMRQRYLEYVQNRMKVYLKILEDGPEKPGEEGDSGRKSGKRSGKSFDRNKSTGNKSSSVGSATSSIPNEQNLKARAEALATEIVGQFQDPFCKGSIRMRGGWTYCLGNMSLSYLNLCYNNLTYVSIKKLHDVLLHQSRVVKFTESGLMRVLVEGNYMPDTCQEMSMIHNLLCRNMTRFSGRGFTETTNRRKSVSRARVSITQETTRRAVEGAPTIGKITK